MTTLTELQRKNRINVVAYKLVNLFQDFKNFMPTHGLTEAELYQAMHKAVNILEGKKEE